MSARCLLVLGLVLAAPVGARAQEIDPQAELRASVSLLEAGQLAEAEQQLSGLAARYPAVANLWALLGQARYGQKKWPAAAEAFGRGLQLEPENTEMMTSRGICLFAVGELDPARELFLRAASLQPGFSRAHLYLGRIAAEAGQSELAERELTRATEAEQPEPLAFFYLGLYLFRERRLESAAQAFERCLELAPALPGAHMNLGLVLQRLGREAEAAEHLERFKSLSGAHIEDLRIRQRVTYYLRSAIADLEQGNLGSALSLALVALEQGPQVPAVHRILAQIYDLQGRKEEAADSLKRAEALSGEGQKR